MSAADEKAHEAVAHVLRAIRDDGRKAWLLGFGSQSFELLTEAYAARNGLNVEAFRKEFWANCRPERVTAAAAPTMLEALRAARDFIEHGAFNIPSKERFDAVLAEIDAALAPASIERETPP